MTKPPLAMDIAVRAYPRPNSSPKGRRHDPGPPSGIVVTIDCETRVGGKDGDVSQRLLFASYRVHAPDGRLVEEGLVASDDLSDPERRIVEDYRMTTAQPRVRLLTRQQFINWILWGTVYKARATLVGFNLFYDESRLALGWRPARGKLFDGGVTLRFWPEWIGPDGKRHPHLYRPEVRVRTLDSKRALRQFTKPRRVDPSNLGPNGKPFLGHFVDCRAASYAFSDRGHSLESACKAFGVERPKQAYQGKHGVLTREYIDYNREDVRATYSLFRKLAAEHVRHPIDLPLTQALSPAAIAKAYLRKMGIRPALEKNPRFSFERLGQAMSAYYGGRAECRIRLSEVPVVYTDLSSMYPTVFSLGGLWSTVIADRLHVQIVTREVRELLGSVDREALLDPAIWRRLALVFCRIRPGGQLLPIRAEYAANGWQIGLNYLDSAPGEMVFTLADLVANAILGGPSAEVIEAFRIVPTGVQEALEPVAFRGKVQIDPHNENLFTRLVEERHRAMEDEALPTDEREALAGALKTMANAASYGIWAEMRDEPSVVGGVEVDVAGLRRFACRVSRPEKAGEFCFPPLAATVTGLARLLLALLQSETEARGGTYLACDTDSLIAVASRMGGEISLRDGTSIHALSWREVDMIRERLNRLNPYDSRLIPDLVKLERENLADLGDGKIDPGQRVELYGVAISAKRFVLYEHAGVAEVKLRKRSRHGLGALLSPTGRRADASWIDEVWERIIARTRGIAEAREPAWYRLPALSQVSATSAGVLRTFAEFNAGRPYAEQVKPANFLLLAHDDPLVALPAGLDRGRLTLIAPFSSEPDEWLRLGYRNRFGGRPIAITTRPEGSAGAVRVKTFGDVIDRYANHPEAKSAGSDGEPCRRATVGLLHRLHLCGSRMRHIGKESNQLEEVEAGGLRTVEDPVREYVDARGEWELARNRLVGLRDSGGLALLRAASGLSERALRDALNRGRMPRAAARARLLELLSTGGSELG